MLSYSHEQFDEEQRSAPVVLRKTCLGLDSKVCSYPLSDILHVVLRCRFLHLDILMHIMGIKIVLLRWSE